MAYSLSNLTSGVTSGIKSATEDDELKEDLQNRAAFDKGVGSGGYSADKYAGTGYTATSPSSPKKKNIKGDRITFALDPNRRESKLRQTGFTNRLEEQVRKSGKEASRNLRLYGAESIGIGTKAAEGLYNTSGKAADYVEDIQGRDKPSTDFSASNLSLAGAQSRGGELADIEREQGPSSAEAQLQRGLNAAQMSSLAMARSGTGFGQSASNLTQAIDSNAAAAQQAALDAATIRAREEADRKARLAKNLSDAAGIDIDVAAKQIEQAEFKTSSELDAEANRDKAAADFSDLEQRGITSAGDLGLRGYAQAGNQELGAFGADVTSVGTELSIEQAVEAADQADADRIIQWYGMKEGLAMQKSAQNKQFWAGIIQAGATVTGAAAGAFVGGPAGAVVGGAATNRAVGQWTSQDSRNI